MASTTFPDYILRQKQLWLDTLAVIKSYRRKTADWDTSLDDNFWRFVGNHPTAKQFSVNISELSLEESSPSADPAKFLLVRPIDPVLMKQWLGEITPSPGLPNLSRLSVFGQSTDPSQRYHVACSLFSRVISLVRELGYKGKTLFSRSLRRWPFMKDTQQSYLDGIYIAIACVLDYQESGDSLEPPSAPHSVAFLACMSPMRDDLLAQELLTIFRLAIHRYLTSTGGFRVVPVTLITVSGDNLRVLHAYIDDVSRIINVRKSKIYNINIKNLGVKGPEQFWTLILQWVLATPDMQSVHDLQKRFPPSRRRRQRAEPGRDRGRECPETRPQDTRQQRYPDAQRGGYDNQQRSPAPPTDRRAGPQRDYYDQQQPAPDERAVGGAAGVPGPAGA
ncbi:hypothetical protein RB598_009462 [Gaeumannomyces tritici]